MKLFLRRSDGLLGVCCLWAAVVIVFGFVATYQITRYHPIDPLDNSKETVQLERRLRRSTKNPNGEKAVLGDELVAGVVQSLENIKGITLML
jgi:hypothetical protein